jgi:hypothetical protein
MKVAMVAKAKKIKLHRFAFDHFLIRDVIYKYLSEIWLTCFRTQRSEFGAHKRRPRFGARILVVKSL